MADEKSEKPKLKEFDWAHFHYEGKRFEARAVSRGEFEALKRFGDYEELVSSFHGCESRATNVYMVSTRASDASHRNPRSPPRNFADVSPPKCLDQILKPTDDHEHPTRIP
jgi:hypothetical protein